VKDLQQNLNHVTNKTVQNGVIGSAKESAVKLVALELDLAPVNA